MRPWRRAAGLAARPAACGRAGLWAAPGHGRERGAGEVGAEHLRQWEI